MARLCLRPLDNKERMTLSRQHTVNFVPYVWISQPSAPTKIPKEGGTYSGILQNGSSDGKPLLLSARNANTFLPRPASRKSHIYTHFQDRGSKIHDWKHHSTATQVTKWGTTPRNEILVMSHWTHLPERWTLLSMTHKVSSFKCYFQIIRTEVCFKIHSQVSLTTAKPYSLRFHSQVSLTTTKPYSLRIHSQVSLTTAKPFSLKPARRFTFNSDFSKLVPKFSPYSYSQKLTWADS